MHYKFLVTCGRGFENHVIKEVNEKFNQIKEIMLINEGKIYFKLHVTDAATMTDSDLCKNLYFNNALNKIFEIKLIERVLLLLFYESMENMNSDWKKMDGCQLADAICSSVNWTATTQQVRLLHRSHVILPILSCTCEQQHLGLQEELTTQHEVLSYMKNKRKIDKIYVDDFSGNKYSNSGQSCGKKCHGMNKCFKAIDSVVVISESDKNESAKLQVNVNEIAHKASSKSNIFIPHVKCNKLLGRSCIDTKKSNFCVITDSTSTVLHEPNDVEQCPNAQEVSTNELRDTLPQINKNDENVILFRASSRVTGHWKTNLKTSFYRACTKSGTTDHMNDGRQTVGVYSKTDGECNKTEKTDESENDDPIVSLSTRTATDISRSNDNLFDVTPKFPTCGSLLSVIVTSVLNHTEHWQLSWQQPSVDIYFNLTDLHALLGVSLTRLPLSLRPYIPHINLRSTVCCLMLRLAMETRTLVDIKFSSSASSTTDGVNICSAEKEINGMQDHSMPPIHLSAVQSSESLNKESSTQSYKMPDRSYSNEATASTADDIHSDGTSFPNSSLCSHSVDRFVQPLTLLDPMCGSGTILAEAAFSFKIPHVIGCDVSADQLTLSSCNLRSLPPHTTATLLRADAAHLPLSANSVDCVVCDFPFGKKHWLYDARTSRGCPGNCSGADSNVNCVNVSTKGSSSCNSVHVANDNNCTNCGQPLLFTVLDEFARVLVPGGRAVLLINLKMEPLIDRYEGRSNERQLSLLSRHHIALGTTSGLVCVLQTSCVQQK